MAGLSRFDKQVVPDAMPDGRRGEDLHGIAASVCTPKVSNEINKKLGLAEK